MDFELKNIIAALAQKGAVPPVPPAGTAVPVAGSPRHALEAEEEVELHKPEDPPSWSGGRVGVFIAVEAIVFVIIRIGFGYVLGKVNADPFYAWILSIIAWVVFSVLLFKTFFRTVGVYQLAHTQDMVSGKLRRYSAGTKLMWPWETLTPDKIVDTEAKVLNVPDTKVATADGSPLIASIQIRYRVAPALSHRFIGIVKKAVEESLTRIAIQLTREEVARCVDPEDALKRLPDEIQKDGSRKFGVLGMIEDRMMNGEKITRFEKEHGIRIEGVPISLVLSPEIEKHILERFEDKRLAQSAEALKGNIKEAQLALLNNPNSKLTHTISEELETGDRVYTLNIGGTSGESLKDIAAVGHIVGKTVADSMVKKEGGRRQKQQSQQQKGQP